MSPRLLRRVFSQPATFFFFLSFRPLGGPPLPSWYNLLSLQRGVLSFSRDSTGLTKGKKLNGQHIAVFPFFLEYRAYRVKRGERCDGLISFDPVFGGRADFVFSETT